MKSLRHHTLSNEIIVSKWSRLQPVPVLSMRIAVKDVEPVQSDLLLRWGRYIRRPLIKLKTLMTNARATYKETFAELSSNNSPWSHLVMFLTRPVWAGDVDNVTLFYVEFKEMTWVWIDACEWLSCSYSVHVSYLVTLVLETKNLASQ